MDEESVLNTIKRMRWDHLRHGGDPKKITMSRKTFYDMVSGVRELMYIVLIMFAIIILLTGCEKVKVEDENGEYVNSNFGLIEIEDKHQKQLLYDPETKIVYMYIYSLYRAGISPYYVIGENGKPEVAMYGVNYKESR